jgi:hypothetical protein
MTEDRKKMARSSAFIAVCVCSALASPAVADSFTLFGIVPCPIAPTTADSVVAWPGQYVGSASRYQKTYAASIGAMSSKGMPASFVITATEVTREGGDPNTYLVLGKLDVTGSGGDYISPRFYGNGTSTQTAFPAETRPVFLPGDELHLHTNGCGLAIATIYYYAK